MKKVASGSAGLVASAGMGDWPGLALTWTAVTGTLQVAPPSTDLKTRTSSAAKKALSNTDADAYSVPSLPNITRVSEQLVITGSRTGGSMAGSGLMAQLRPPSVVRAYEHDWIGEYTSPAVGIR